MPVANERIGRLCARLVQAGFEDRVARYGVTELIARITAGVKSGVDPDTLLDDLDALDDAFARHGIDGLTTVREYRPLPGFIGHPTMHVWTCPAPVPCARADMPASGAAPSCAITDMPLIQAEISP